jgi:hypothetical protein
VEEHKIELDSGEVAILSIPTGVELTKQDADMSAGFANSRVMKKDADDNTASEK